jgi:DNA-binding protein HU-alpha
MAKGRKAAKRETEHETEHGAEHGAEHGDEASGEPGEALAADAAATLRMRDLLERVVARSGAKKKDAKAVVEATLAVLGEALAKGESLNLPEFGKARVSRQKDSGGVEITVVKLRRVAPKAVKLAPTEADG